MRDTRPPSGAGGAGRGSFSIGSAVVLDRTWPHLCRPDQGDIHPHEIERRLDDIIASEVLPRLVLRHRRQGKRRGGGGAPVVKLSAQVADFAELVIRHETSVAVAYVKYLLHRGLDVETLLLHFLAPAARRLGELWESDKIDFVDVTIGASRLQQLLHHLTGSLPARADISARRLLLVPAPGEQHTFGLVMASEMFRREGWQVHGVAPIGAEEFFSLISQQQFDLIGFSVSCDRLIGTLCSSIQAARRISRNKSVRIMVGGRVFAQDPAVGSSVGADLVASDAREALVLADNAFRKSVCR
jgi:MerR family transcriptional regulator, light-induced transcriptional regulator